MDELLLDTLLKASSIDAKKVLALGFSIFFMISIPKLLIIELGNIIALGPILETSNFLIMYSPLSINSGGIPYKGWWD